MQAGREIEFRGMGVNGKWHYGYLNVVTDKRAGVPLGCYISNNAGMPFAYQVRPETVGQFVGQVDKTGERKIYEGDITKNKHGAIGVIKFHKSWGAFCFDTILGYNEEKELVRMSSAVPMWNEWSTLTIIGDIYENHELL
ncbi:hypothetical protein BP422_13190 [Brevibacillus formosus]|uniref:YopX protein domain-containing protein n=1 Tax=Brevibacillus formosus TaxID=54913 RepID=A0A220MHA6_9BACL|nr:YopX family protein [Brevibacillus formosus]ASJ54428.1 hypothetical protein BP422_13190 [Brevibacillus formosus]